MTDDRRDPRDRNIWRSPGGMLYFKISVPPKLRNHFRSETGKPKPKLTESLGTDSLAQARILRDQRVAHWARVFARLEAGAALRPEEIATERQRIRSSSLQALLATAPMTTAEADKLNQVWVASIQAKQPDLLAEVTAEVRAIADEKYGVGVITEDSEPWKEIWKLVARAKAKAFEDRLVVLLRSQSPLSEFPSDTMEQSNTPAPILPANGNGGLERFSVALEHYITWLRDEQKARPLTVADYKSKAECFVKFANDPPLGAVDIDQAKAFLKHIAETGAGDATVNHYHFVCRKVFEYTRVERHKFKGENPFSFQRRKAETTSKAKFTIDELNTLFNSPVFADREIKPKTYGVTSALPWAALIALYSGAGLEEICQLRTRDIRKEAGVWIVDITKEAALSGALKRTARQRIVPLHPELERLGLLKYLAALPRGADRLFPGLPMPTKGKDKFGSALGKQFARWRKKLGIDYEDRQLDFHSLRHCFCKVIEDSGISAEDRARLLGHKVKGISSSVYSAPELKRVAPLVAGVKWDGLKIDR
jgi:integrase